MSTHLTQAQLDLLVLSSGPTADATQAHLQTCERCATRLAALRADQERFAQFVFPRTVAAVEARVQSPSFFERFRLKLWLPAAGVATALAVVAASQLTGGTQTEDDLYVGIKGAPTLEVWAARGTGGAFALSPEVPLQPDDRIRFVVNPAGSRFVLIASRDGAGAFTVYYPFGATQSGAVEANTRAELPGSVQLDATLGAEQLYAIFSDRPLTSAEVEAALRAGGQPQLAGAQVVEKRFTKVAR